MSTTELMVCPALRIPSTAFPLTFSAVNASAVADSATPAMPTTLVSERTYAPAAAVAKPVMTFAVVDIVMTKLSPKSLKSSEIDVDE